MDVLLIDDEASLRRTLRTTLEAMGHAVVEAGTREAALQQLHRRPADVALLDLRLGAGSGLDLLPELLQAAPELAVVVMTAYAAIDTAVEAMRRGAADYLPKPFTPDQLRVALNRCETVRRLQARVSDLQDELRAAVPGGDLFTREPAVQRVLDVAARVAGTDATDLLRGESGTGKGVLARAIHRQSGRAVRPFVTVSCPSLSAELLESDLFGHVKGAFTGAVRDADGKVAAAAGGTLFLDEIGDLPPALQPKLLRFLQDREYERVGETMTRTGDVRIVAATNRDLEADVAAGRFREDLFYRLNVIELRLPPLRDRPADLLPLARHLLGFFAAQTGRRVIGFTPEATAALQAHRWPGNVRELRNAVERAAILATGPEVGTADLPEAIGRGPAPPPGVGGRGTLDELEAEHIRRVLASAASLDEAAEVLGIDPSTLYRKRKKFGL